MIKWIRFPDGPNWFVIRGRCTNINGTADWGFRAWGSLTFVALWHWGTNPEVVVYVSICYLRLVWWGQWVNSLSPSAGILLNGPLGTNFNENLIEIHTFSFTKMSSGKWRPFCLGISVLSVEVSSAISRKILSAHYDVTKWKHFLRYWPFMRGSIGHRSPYKGTITRTFDVSLLSIWTNTPLTSNSRHHDGHLTSPH